MRHCRLALLFVCVVAMLLAACSSPPETVEVTREVPVTVEVEVTREVPVTVVIVKEVEVPVTVEVEVIVTATKKPTPTKRKPTATPSRREVGAGWKRYEIIGSDVVVAIPEDWNPASESQRSVMVESPNSPESIGYLVSSTVLVQDSGPTSDKIRSLKQLTTEFVNKRDTIVFTDEGTLGAPGSPVYVMFTTTDYVYDHKSGMAITYRIIDGKQITILYGNLTKPKLDDDVVAALENLAKGVWVE